MDLFTLTLKSDAIRIMTAGIKEKIPILKMSYKSSPIPLPLKIIGFLRENPRYKRDERRKGILPVLNMDFILSKRSVLVRSETKIALEDIGEQRSPKYAPDIMAPVTRGRSMSPALAITMRATPMVLTVPRDVPKRKETKEVIIKA